MTNHVNPEFFKAFEHYKAMLKQYGDDGEAIYDLRDIAKHLGVSFEEAEQRLLQLVANKKAVGLPTDGVLVNPTININRIQ